jgi:hypothetical protein
MSENGLGECFIGSNFLSGWFKDIIFCCLDDC